MTQSSICGSPQCLNSAAPYSDFCYQCIRKWSGRARPTQSDDDLKLYLIAGADLVKIGETKSSVASRLMTMQTGSPVKLSIIGHVPSQKRWEESLHRLLIAHRSHGEWFRREGRVLSLIEWVTRKDTDSIRAFIDRSWSVIAPSVALHDKVIGVS